MVKSNDNSAYKRGQELLDQGLYQEAVAQFDEALAEQPDSWKTLNSKGFAYQKMSKYTEAVECFDKALAINPQSVEVLNNKGVTLSMRGLYKDAIACFDQAVAIDSTSLEALNGKAIALQHMFSYKEALDVLEQAMKIDPKHTQTLLSIAVTLQKLKQYERAISFFKKVLSVDRSNIKAWNGVGVTYQLMGDNNSALKCFTKILNINSQEIQAWISIGFVYQKIGKFNDALKCYKKAQMVINNRYHHKLYDGLASCLTKLSEFDQAIEVYKQIFQREEGKKKWDAQRSIKFVNKLKRKKAVGTLQPPTVSGGDAVQGGDKRREALLPIDDELLGGGIALVVEPDRGLLVLLVVRGLPQNAVADGIPLEHRVEQVSDVAVLPDEWPLEVGKANASLDHITDELADRPVDSREQRLRHSDISFAAARLTCWSHILFQYKPPRQKR